MSLEEFVSVEKSRFERWYSWWLEMRKHDPINYPLSGLTHEEWRVEYEMYDEEGPQK